jgi:hypothetical protein
MNEGPYFHGAIGKSEADALLLADGGDRTSGKFLFRSKRESSDNFILSVIYKGKPTHHSAEREGKGKEFALNKVPTGANTLEELAIFLEKKNASWPVPLIVGVPNSSNLLTLAPSGDLNGPYLHGSIKKEAAEELLLANSGSKTAGKFLFRSKGASTDNFILSVIYKGKATHHTVQREAEGKEFEVNKVGHFLFLYVVNASNSPFSLCYVTQSTTVL